MDQLQAFTLADELHGMFADDIAASGDGEANFTAAARAMSGIANQRIVGIEIDAACVGYIASKDERGAGRRVLFIAMMGFVDFAIEVGEASGRVTDELAQDGDANAEIRAPHQGYRSGGCAHRVVLGIG